MAGESAWTKAQQHRRMADQYERGAKGEEATASALAELPADTWTVLHDVAWPGRKRANIDHVAVGPAGVFVIDSKNWSGRITVDEGVLRQNRRARASTLRSAEAGAGSVAALVPELRRDHVHAVLCFVGSEVPNAVVDAVLVCSTGTLASWLASGPAVMSDEGARAVAHHLRSRLPAATDPRPALVSGPRPRPEPVLRGRKRRLPKGLVTGAAGVVLVVSLATHPAPFIALTNGISGLITDQMAPPEDKPVEPTEKTTDKTPAKKKAKQERHQER